MQKTPPAQKQRLSVEDFLYEFSMSRTTFYEKKNRGEIKFIKDGGRIYITRKDAEAWFNQVVVASE